MKLLEKLKELLGEEKFEEMKETFNGLDEQYLDINDASRIPKERFDEINQKYKEAKEIIENLNTKVGELESNDEIEKIKLELEEARTKNKEFEANELKREKDNYVDSILKELNVKDLDYIKYKTGVESLEFKDGKIDGFKEKVTELANDESLKSFFNEKKQVGIDNENKNLQENKNNPINSIEQIKAMSTSEVMARRDEINTFMQSQGK